MGAIRNLKSGQKLLKPKKQALRRIKKVEVEKFYPRTKQADNGTETKTC